MRCRRGDLVGEHVVDPEHGQPVHPYPVPAGGSPAFVLVGEPDPGFPGTVVLPPRVDETGGSLALVLELDLDVGVASAARRKSHEAECTYRKPEHGAQAECS